MIELIATEGNVYALKSDLSIYGKIITLGKEDSPDNWIEIPEPTTKNEDQLYIVNQ